VNLDEKGADRSVMTLDIIIIIAAEDLDETIRVAPYRFIVLSLLQCNLDVWVLRFFFAAFS